MEGSYEAAIGDRIRVTLPQQIKPEYTQDYSSKEELLNYPLKRQVLPIEGKGQPEGHTGPYDAKLFQPYLMQGSSAKQLLEGVRSRSAALDTPMQIEGDKGVITISPSK